jgi:hypothetical protein
MKKIIDIIFWPYTWVKAQIAFRKKMKELKNRDPFIYK